MSGNVAPATPKDIEAAILELVGIVGNMSSDVTWPADLAWLTTYDYTKVLQAMMEGGQMSEAQTARSVNDMRIYIFSYNTNSS